MVWLQFSEAASLESVMVISEVAYRITIHYSNYRLHRKKTHEADIMLYTSHCCTFYDYSSAWRHLKFGTLLRFI